jgi:hypothetical protein
MAPWSNRREVAGLLGTFLVFFISCSGHSDTFVNQTRQLAQQLIRLALVFLGLVTPAAQSPTAQFHHIIGRLPHIRPAIAPVIPIIAKSPVSSVANGVPMNAFQKHWTYIFEGKATLHDQPCPNASVLVRVTNGDQSVAQGTITGADGSYSLTVAVDAREGDPVDWTLDAFTPDFQKVELFGRKIVKSDDVQDQLKDQKPIVVNAPVEFLLTLNH